MTTMITETTWAEQQAAAQATLDNAPDLTDVQFRAAFNLARSYGHEWAWSGAQPSVERKLAEIHRISEATTAGTGIGGPIPGENGTVVHVTGSGRLAWQVRPDGSVSFTVARPVGEAIYADVTADGAVDVAGSEDYLPPVAFSDRHIDALVQAVDALLGRGHYSPTAIVRAAMALPGYDPALSEAERAPARRWDEDERAPLVYGDLGGGFRRLTPEEAGGFSDVVEATFTPEDE